VRFVDALLQHDSILPIVNGPKSRRQSLQPVWEPSAKHSIFCTLLLKSRIASEDEYPSNVTLGERQIRIWLGGISRSEEGC
jgi:hypothetical protein